MDTRINLMMGAKLNETSFIYYNVIYTDLHFIN